MLRKLSLAAALCASVAVPAVAQDFGQTVENMLAQQSLALFGIAAPLTTEVPETGDGYRTANSTADDALAVAPGLTASFLTREAGNAFDQFAFYPAENPTHIIGCVESRREEIADGKYNPSVQSVSLADGTVTTILRGLTSCDPVRVTPWGTVLVGEERTDGLSYEILDPLNVANVTVTNRATGETDDPEHVVGRLALPTIGYEGVGITAEGVVYAGDELRPGSDTPDADGGAIFKFVPDHPATGGMITSLDQSPFTSGSVYAMQVSCIDDGAQFGQGCDIGNAMWIPVNAATARSDANANAATGYYRPEDGLLDPAYTGEGVRFCWTNTWEEGAQSYAEVLCLVDTTPSEVAAADGTGLLNTAVSRFVQGDTVANSFDNLEFQPGTGIMYVIEDHPNGDIWACLPDGTDRDLMTDGCIKVFTVKDTTAEPTGFIFAPDGLTAYVSIQHSDDTNMSPVDDFGTDDIIKITGFQTPAM